MQHRSEIVSTLTQFKSVYRRHLHPDIRKKINLPSIGLNRRSLKSMSDAQLLAKTKKLIETIDAIQYERDREHKGLKAFTSHLKDIIDDNNQNILHAHNHLIQLIYLLSNNHGIDKFNEIKHHAEMISKCPSADIRDQAQKAIQAHIKQHPDLQNILPKTSH